MLRRLAFSFSLLAACASIGCASSSESPTTDDGSSSADTTTIQVPDVANEDGAQAQTDIEDAGLQPTLADANDDPGFDTSRDATDCEVIDQDPAAGSDAEDADEVTITVDCSQVDWGNQEGTQWEAFSDAYSSGFDQGCEDLFNESPDGSLYEDDTEYAAVDCQSDNPGDGSEASDIPSDVPDDPEQAGTDVGELDGCQSMFENEGVISLNYGQDSYTEADCPIGAAAPTHRVTTTTPAASAKPVKRSSKKTAGQTCTGTEANGSQIVLTVTSGEINCKGAVALLNEWLRRAPHEGVGSGGNMTLYGWDCLGAHAVQWPKIGTCERRGNDPAAFEAREEDNE